MNAGDIIYIFCPDLNTPKYKYAICFYPTDRLFFFINTYRRKYSPDGDVLVTTSEISCLKHTSYINTSFTVQFLRSHIYCAIYKESLSNSIKKRIRQTVSRHNYLPPRYQKLVQKHLV